MKNAIYLIVMLCLLFACIEQRENKARMVLDSKATLGEGAIWDHRSGILYWVDIEEGILNLYKPQIGANREIDLGQRVGTVVPVDTGGVLVALQGGIYRLDPGTGKKMKLVHPEKSLPDNRYNDGKCDPSGRFWVGSMGLNSQKHAGALYRINPDLSWEKMIDSVTISNGIVWSPDTTRMYYIDTPTQKVMAYRFDNRTGQLSDPEIAIEIPDTLGHPDGSTLDAEGMIWIAMWGGHAVTRWNPQTGELLRRIEVPAPNVSSCAFGGKNLETLYITTARAGMDEEQLKKYSHSGGLFKVKPGVRGMRSNCFRSAEN